jgi:hypothetical protein
VRAGRVPAARRTSQCCRKPCARHTCALSMIRCLDGRRNVSVLYLGSGHRPTCCCLLALLWTAVSYALTGSYTLLLTKQLFEPGSGVGCDQHSTGVRQVVSASILAVVSKQLLKPLQSVSSALEYNGCSSSAAFSCCEPGDHPCAHRGSMLS